VSLSTMQPAGLSDPQVRRLLPRVRATISNGGQDESRGTFPMPGIVSVTLADGRTIQSEVVYVKGHPNNPMTFSDVAAKMHACGEFAGLGSRQINDIVEFVDGIERAEDVGRLAGLIAPRRSISAAAAGQRV
jgi:2-methylcitrate dehydratase PrpD